MTKLFFVTSHGSAGDQLFEWLPRSVKAHPDIFIYMGESVRSKYFKERERGIRPSLDSYERFLKDIGGGYVFAGEFYSYRAHNFDGRVPIFSTTVNVNILRDPLILLYFFTRWIVFNCNLPVSDQSAIAHEFEIIDHDDLQRKGFLYNKTEVNKWAFLRGIQILNKMISDTKKDNVNYCLEKIYDDFDDFLVFLKEITEQNIIYSQQQFEQSKLFSHKRPNFPKKAIKRKDIIQEFDRWHDRAIEKLLNYETRRFFEDVGYDPI